MASFYNRYYRYYRPYFPAPYLAGFEKRKMPSSTNVSSSQNGDMALDDRGSSSVNLEHDRGSSSNSKCDESSSCSDKRSCSSNGFSFGPLFFNAPFGGDLESPVFEVFGIKLFLDDIIIVGLLFFLYNEGVQDELLYIALILLLIG